FRCARTLVKSISGISRSDAGDGPMPVLEVAFFIFSPFCPRGPACADDPDRVAILDGEHGEDQPGRPRLPDQDETLGMLLVLHDHGERICKALRRLFEGDAVLSLVALGLGWIPLEPHTISVTQFMAEEARSAADPVAFSGAGGCHRSAAGSCQPRPWSGRRRDRGWSCPRGA